jgi:hypothetical protein
MYSRRASRIREERLTRARLAALFVARSNSESNTTWMVSMLWTVLHNRIHSQRAATRVQPRLVASARTSLRSNLAPVGALEAMLAESKPAAYWRASRARAKPRMAWRGSGSVAVR